MSFIVIPAKAWISGQEVADLLHDWAGADCPAVRSYAGGMATCPIPAFGVPAKYYFAGCPFAGATA